MTGLRLALACALGAMLSSPAAVRAESQLVLDYPPSFETVPAATYDEDRQRIGGAHLVVEKLEDGNVRMIAESGFDGGARNVVQALLEPVDVDKGLRLLQQESRSFDAGGQPLGVLSIDHRAGTASCRRPDGSLVETLDLPVDDRVANVPLNLLFLPLVHGDTDKMNYQVFLCRGGARLMDFEAWVARRERGSNGHDPLVEVRYGPDFGGLMSIVAQNFVPNFAVWFDPKRVNPWLAHRIPLYAKGPEVLVIREGIPPGELGPD